jgi:hypothetical protein
MLTVISLLTAPQVYEAKLAQPMTAKQVRVVPNPLLPFFLCTYACNYAHHSGQHLIEILGYTLVRTYVSTAGCSGSKEVCKWDAPAARGCGASAPC